MFSMKLTSSFRQFRRNSFRIQQRRAFMPAFLHQRRQSPAAL